MPELPEVETVVRTLRPCVLGEKIARVELARKDIVWPAGVDLPKRLTGRTIVSVERRAKRIVIGLDDQNRFYIHLGMSGWLTVERPGAAREKHTHMILHLAKEQVRFCDPRRFGGVWWMGCDSMDEGIGPEPLGLGAEELGERLKGTRRAIKTTLLDQAIVAGLGNIYVDESLYSAGIHPLTRADRLTGEQVRRLNDAIQKVLTQAIEHRGSTLRNFRNAYGESGEFQKLHRVYQRAGEPCLQCGALLKRMVLGGRGTHYCGRCQRRGGG